jgi:hypothetical protein
MDQKIIIGASETVTCPKCSHTFPLDKGITRQTIQRYEHEFEESLTEHRKAVEKQLAAEATKRAAKQFGAQIEDLTQQVADSKRAANHATAQLEKARQEGRTKAAKEFDIEKKVLTEELAEKDKRLGEFRKQELQLRSQQKKLAEDKENLGLEVERRLAVVRQQIELQTTQRETERFSLKEAEYKKKLEDAERSVAVLQRKLDQGSQQLQGEVLELEVEHVLSENCRHDRISEVKKGVRGADVLHEVCTPTGQVCGTIIWEAKRAEKFSDGWIQKVKEDQRDADAHVAVLVTTAMPKGVTDPFVQLDGVWIIPPHLIKPVALALRSFLIDLQRVSTVNTGRENKAELLYNYMSSPQFSHTIKSVVETFVAMKAQLDAERRSLTRHWAQREVHIDKVLLSVSELVGHLQGITHDGLPQLNDIETLALPDPNFLDPSRA